MDKKKKTLVFSFTEISNFENILDVIRNIKYFTKDFKTFFIVTIKDNIIIPKKLMENINNIDFLITKFPENNWGTIYTLEDYMESIRFLLKIKKIHFDFFILFTSNSMFVKNFDKNYINVIEEYYKKNNINYESTKKFYKKYFYNFLKKKEKEDDWYWLQYLKLDKGFINFCYERNYYIKNGPSEGLILNNFQTRFILKKYEELNIVKNTTYPKYCLEEIFIHTVFYNYFGYLPLSITFRHDYKNPNWFDFKQKNELDIGFFSYKWFSRDINDVNKVKLRIESNNYEI